MEAHEQGLEDLQKGRLGMHEYKTGAALRKAVGTEGQGHQSLHIVPQVVYRSIGQDPDTALTVDLPTEFNTALDRVWKRKWKTAMDRGKRITGKDIRDSVAESIQSVSDSLLSKAAKNSLEWRLEVELKELGIAPETVMYQVFLSRLRSTLS